MVKILKSDNPKRSYAHLTFGVLKRIKFGFQSLRFTIGSIANWARNHYNYFQLSFNFSSKTFTVHIKHINSYDFLKIEKSKKKKKKKKHVFSVISPLGLFSSGRSTGQNTMSVKHYKNVTRAVKLGLF